jgi:PTH1 family peptidyl-tRNA hydrolase
MAKAKRLIVGLGNPGPECDGTRHNIGFEVARAVAARTRIAIEPLPGRSLGGWGSWRARPVGVAMPMTYMNLSGEAVKALVRAHQLEPADVLVIVDDLALDPGVLRLRPGGSDGGHNGLKSLNELLKTDQYPRLRVGIGKDFPRGRQADYVLEPFTAEQQVLVDQAIPVAVKQALTWVVDGVQTAMNRFNKWRPEVPGDEARSE